jgi:hypothetical protein
MSSEIPIEKLSETQYAIIGELTDAVGKLGACVGLLAALGSWGDTLPESKILEMLQDLNKIT